MLLQIILFLILGILAGTITGLLPGIHVNLIGAIIVSLFFSKFYDINVIYFIAFIVAMSITHIFIAFIPSIFLGCPDTDTELSVLPGHELLKTGHGFQAVKLAAIGALFGIFILILLSFPFISITEKIYNSVKVFIPYILITTSFLLVFTEKNKFSALFIFLLSGILGFIVLNLNIKESLLPLLSGLFGVSTLIISIKTKTTIPEQKIRNELISKKEIFKPILGAAISSPLTIFLPALGAGQIAIIGNSVARQDKKGFLLLLGAVNSLTMGFSFLALFTISKTRTGSAVAIKELIGIPSINIFILILITILFSGIISYFIVLKLAKIFSKILWKVNYTKLSIAVLAFVFLIVLIFSGFLGFLILIISTLTGIYCISTRVRRTNMMGCLLLPTIILYLF